MEITEISEELKGLLEVEESGIIKTVDDTIPDYIELQGEKMQTVAGVKRQGIIDKECAQFIPSLCEKCGSIIVMSDTYKTMMCSNEDCETKIVRRMELLLKELKIAEFGKTTCEKFITECNLQKPYDIFKLDDSEYPDYLSEDMKIKLYNNLHRNKRFTLPRLVKALHLKGISDSADKILKGYDNIDKFFVDLKDMGQELTAKQLGVGTYGGITYNVLKELVLNEKDIKEFVGLFEIESSAETLFTIAITDSVECTNPDTGAKFKNKDEYVDYLTSLGKGKVLRSDSLNLSCFCLVADSYDPNDDSTWTGKIKKVIGWQNKGKDVKVMTSHELLEYVKAL